MNLCPTWKFVIENEQTWRKVRQQYLSEFRCIDSSMLARLNVLRQGSQCFFPSLYFIVLSPVSSFGDLLEEQNRLEASLESPVTMAGTISRFLPESFITGLKRIASGLSRRDRLVIFGPGMGKGFINFLMWECTSIGVQTTVENGIQPDNQVQVPGQPRRSNALTLGKWHLSKVQLSSKKFQSN